MTGRVLALLVVLALPRPALAQTTEQIATARALFEEGIGLAQRNQLREAEDRFRRSLALNPHPSAQYNLASVLADQGRLVEAVELYRTLADRASDAQIRSDAAQQVRVLAPRLARLAIHLEGDVSGVSVRLGARELQAAALGVAVPVDPGQQRIDALRAAAVIASAEVSLPPGGAGTIRLTIPAGSGGSIAEAWWLWTIVGVVVAGAAVGVALGVALSEVVAQHPGTLGVITGP